MSDHNAMCLDIGDEVEMHMDEEARHWRGGRPDGTRGYVVGYTYFIRYSARFGLDLLYGHEPGIYEMRGNVLVQWPDGNPESANWDIRAIDRDKWERRLCERVRMIDGMPRDEERARRDRWLHRHRIGDLPETEFWEGDVLTMSRSNGEQEFVVITGINYHYLYQWTSTTPPHPMQDHALYEVRMSDENGTDIYRGRTCCGTKNAVLHKRGNLWRMYHGEPLVFLDLKDECAFRYGLMQTDEVRNPANGLFKWTAKEAIDAIREGTIADGFRMASGFFGMPARPSVMRYHDRDLGERVRAATMAGFQGVVDPDVKEVA